MEVKGRRVSSSGLSTNARALNPSAQNLQKTLVTLWSFESHGARPRRNDRLRRHFTTRGGRYVHA